jgi:hypothetical protein
MAMKTNMPKQKGGAFIKKPKPVAAKGPIMITGGADLSQGHRKLGKGPSNERNITPKVRRHGG